MNEETAAWSNLQITLLSANTGSFPQGREEIQVCLQKLKHSNI